MTDHSPEKTAFGHKKENKRLAALIAAGLMSASLLMTACQPTPEKAVVVNKSESYDNIIAAGEQQSAQDAASTPPYEAPPRWTQTHEEGKLTINVDIDVTLPVDTGFPVAIMERNVFTQAQVDTMVEYFAKGRKLYRLPVEETKEEIMQQILWAKEEQQQMGEYASDYDSWIEELEQRYEAAPETITKEYVDTTLTYQMAPDGTVYEEEGANFLYVGIENEGDAPITYDERSAYDESISVGNASDDNYSSWFSYSRGGAFYTESFYEDNLDAPDIDAATDPTFQDWQTQIKNTAMTEEQAVAAAEQMIADFGITGLGLVDAQGVAFFDKDNFPVKGGYYLRYRQEMNGLLGIGTGGWGQSLHEGENLPEFAPPFYQEQLDICINEDGVHMFSWDSSAALVEKVNNNATLAPFEDVQQAAINQIVYKKSFITREAYCESLRAEIISATLNLGYIGVKDDPNKAMMIPVWIFEVEEHMKFEGDDPESYGNLEAVAISALDASVVDIAPQNWATSEM